MGLYKYKCQHTDCKPMTEGIRKCKECEMVIITDRGVEYNVLRRRTMYSITIKGDVDENTN